MYLRLVMSSITVLYPKHLFTNNISATRDSKCLFFSLLYNFVVIFPWLKISCELAACGYSTHRCSEYRRVQQVVLWTWHITLQLIGPGGLQWNFGNAVLQLIAEIDGWGISCEIVLRLMSLDVTDDGSILVQLQGLVTWGNKPLP